MTTEQIKEAILGLIDEYHISKVIKKLRMALKDYIVIIFTAICHFFMLQ